MHFHVRRCSAVRSLSSQETIDGRIKVLGGMWATSREFSWARALAILQHRRRGVCQMKAPDAGPTRRAAADETAHLKPVDRRPTVIGSFSISAAAFCDMPV
jgi:hypothetical protein